MRANHHLATLLVLLLLPAAALGLDGNGAQRQLRGQGPSSSTDTRALGLSEVLKETMPAQPVKDAALPVGPDLEAERQQQPPEDKWVWLGKAHHAHHGAPAIGP